MPKATVKREPDLTLDDGTGVYLASPGILFDAAVFGRFPDLTEYHAEKLERQIEAQERGEPFRATAEDRRREYELSILFVVHGCQSPRFSAERDPKDGSRSVNSIKVKDFWRIAAAVQARWEEERASEAAAVNPSVAGASS